MPLDFTSHDWLIRGRTGILGRKYAPITIWNAFCVTSIANSVIGVITTTCCVYINEHLGALRPSERKASVFFITLTVGICTNMAVYIALWWFVGYGGSMVNDG